MYIFFFNWLWLWGSSLRFIWQTRKSIVGDSCDVSVPRDSSVKITPKIPAKFASLNSSIAFGDLRLGGCLRAPCSQAPARAQSPARNTRIKRRKIRRSFWGYLDVPGSGVFTPEFTVRALTSYFQILIIFVELQLLLCTVYNCTAGPGSLFPDPENDIFQHSGAIPPPRNILRPVMSSPRYGERLGSFGISKKLKLKKIIFLCMGLEIGPHPRSALPCRADPKWRPKRAKRI